MYPGAAVMEDIMKDPQKNKTPIWSNNSFWDIYLANIKVLIKQNRNLNVHNSIIYNSQDMEVT